MANAHSWRQYEEAVAAFARSLDPKAVVTHNAFEPDRHHGRRRQRDVLIHANLMKLFPITVLVSCKRLKRRLNSTDIEHFDGELRGSRATIGVLFSYGGYNDEAIAKARELKIHCCRLYENSAADLPDMLLFRSYLSIPQIALIAAGQVDLWGIKTWLDVIPTRRADSAKPLGMEMAEYLEQYFRSWARNRTDGRTVPAETQIGVELIDPNGQLPAAMVGIKLGWAHYSAQVGAHRVNGSYSLTHNRFVGSQQGPIIDLKCPPGPGWTPASPEECLDAANWMSGILFNDAQGIYDRILEVAMDLPVRGTPNYIPRAQRTGV